MVFAVLVGHPNFDAHARIQNREMNCGHITGAFIDDKRKINGFVESTNYI